MTNQYAIPNIRFAHDFDRSDVLARGRTIAYQRQEDYIVFAWAHKREGEEYVKSIGRAVAADRLEFALEGTKLAAGLAEQEIVLQIEDRWGAIHVDYFRAMIDADGMIAKNVVNKIDMFFFKHAFLGNFLQAVLDR
jgi:hypothetical protein